MDFRKDIEIDKYNLTEELIEQPQKYYDWGKEYANAQMETLTAKDKLELVKSEMEIKVRNHPSLYDLPDEPKEAAIKAAIKASLKVKKANKAFLDALRTEKILSKAERAFEHRKKSLEGLVFLSNQLYFADPNTDPRTQQSMDRKRILHNAREKIKRR